MNIKFDNINDYSWVKYSNYDMKEINGKTYIYAGSDANLLPCVLKAVTENKVEGDTTSFEIDNIKQEIIVFNLATLVNSEHIKIKFCKHCKNAFIVKNPKAEYCNPQCKNQANVYKIRAKNKN